MNRFVGTRVGPWGLYILCLICLPNQTVNATTASRPGGSGMTWMRTADTLQNGEVVLYDQIGIDSYVILDSNLNDFDTFNTLGLNYGLFDPLELDIQATYLANDQHKTSGIRSYKGILKFNILGDKFTDHYAITVSAFKTTATATVDNKIGSGEVEDGAEINASYYGDSINLHLTLGSATADAKLYSPDVQYYSVDKQYANLGMEFLISDAFIFGIEAIQEQSENPYFDKNQLFAFSLQYKPTGKWEFDFGASFGVPADRSEPAQSFYAGFNYRLGETKKSRQRPAAEKARPAYTAIPTPSAVPAAPRPEFSRQPKPVVSEPPATKPRKKAAQAVARSRVSIKNATGSSASAERIASLLKQKGYAVISIESVSRREKTEIRYLGKNSKQALQLAIILPGNQDLRKMGRLDKDADLEVVIGSDMVHSIR